MGNDRSHTLPPMRVSSFHARPLAHDSHFVRVAKLLPVLLIAVQVVLYQVPHTLHVLGLQRGREGEPGLDFLVILKGVYEGAGAWKGQVVMASEMRHACAHRHHPSHANTPPLVLTSHSMCNINRSPADHPP